MKHAIKTSQLKQVMGYAYQLGVTFKPSPVQGYMELNTWPESMSAKEVKDYFLNVLKSPFELVR